MTNHVLVHAFAEEEQPKNLEEYLGLFRRDKASRDLSRNRGNWRDPDFPKTGWETDSPPLRYLKHKERMTCQMCQGARICFVHQLVHPEYGKLAVGCICAGHLLNDIEGAQNRERLFKASERTEAKRLKKWLKMAWRTAKDTGNEWSTERTVRISISGQAPAVRLYIKDDIEGGAWFNSPHTTAVYPSRALAKRAAFFAVPLAIAHFEEVRKWGDWKVSKKGNLTLAVDGANGTKLRFTILRAGERHKVCAYHGEGLLELSVTKRLYDTVDDAKLAVFTMLQGVPKPVSARAKARDMYRAQLAAAQQETAEEMSRLVLLRYNRAQNAHASL